MRSKLVLRLGSEAVAPRLSTGRTTVDCQLVNVQPPHCKSVNAQRAHTPALDGKRTNSEPSDGKRSDRGGPESKRAECHRTNSQSACGAHRPPFVPSSLPNRRLNLSHLPLSDLHIGHGAPRSSASSRDL